MWPSRRGTPTRDGEAVGSLELAPGEGAIVDVDQASSESSDSV
jgi:hypothetical protein